MLIDHPDTLSQLLAACADPEWSCFHGRLGVWIKIDCGYHRAGLADLGEVEALARTVVESGKGMVQFAGIYSHSGHSYDAQGSRERILGA